MDKLDRLIADKQAEIEEVEKQAAMLADKRKRLEIQLESFKQAAELRPVGIVTGPPEIGAPALEIQSLAAEHPNPNGGGPFGGKKGRQRGDISKGWRKALKRIWQHEQKASYNDFFKAAQASGLKCELPNVRGRVRSMAKLGFVSGSPDEGYLVTDEAVRRFGFKKRGIGEAVSPADSSA